MDSDDPKRLAEWYDILSPSYDRLYGEEQSRKYDRVIEFLKTQRFPALLDIGCGTGQFLLRAQTLYEHGIGLDVSRRMLENARKRKLRNIDLIQGVSNFLPIKSGAIDCTVSISTAKADPSFSDLIRDIGRASRRNSFLVITVFQRSTDATPSSLELAEPSSRISDIETLYLLRLNCDSD